MKWIKSFCLNGSGRRNIFETHDNAKSYPGKSSNSKIAVTIDKQMYEKFVFHGNKQFSICGMKTAREHEGTERDTEGVGQDMSMTLKLFLVSGSTFSETSKDITASI